MLTKKDIASGCRVRFPILKRRERTGKGRDMGKGSLQNIYLSVNKLWINRGRDIFTAI